MELREELPLAGLPARARRTHPAWGDKQILTTYVLEKVLQPRLPKDAAAMIALTPSDLWPGRGWNFVFGQASLRDRVGVWSMYRQGDPEGGEEQYRLFLLRMLKTAAHEIAHMFSLMHCTMYECGMCGSNSRAEADRRPLALCPECMAKVCFAARYDPLERYRKLAEFCRKHRWTPQADFYVRSLRTLGGSMDPESRPAGGEGS